MGGAFRVLVYEKVFYASTDSPRDWHSVRHSHFVLRNHSTCRATDRCLLSRTVARARRQDEAERGALHE